MAQSKTTRPVKTTASTQPKTEQGKVAQALTQAAKQAQQQLAQQGLKLPTQNWAGSAVRNPAV
jgi:hypothetical protein